MRCATSTPRPRSTGGSAFRSARATAIRAPGARRTTSSSFPAPSSSCWRSPTRRGIAPHAPRSFSFGAFNRDFLARGEGLSMLVLEGRGAPDAARVSRGRHRRFRALRVRARGQAARRHAGQGRVLRSPSRAIPAAPDTGFFTCQHRYPENFWNPAFQHHPNTASGGRRRGAGRRQSERPSHLPAAFTGERELQATSAGIAHQDAARRDPGDGARRRSASISAPSRRTTARGARLAALRFAVRDLAAVGRSGCAVAGTCARFEPHGPHRSSVRTTAMGATLVFEQDLSVDRGCRPAAMVRPTRTAHERRASSPTPSSTVGARASATRCRSR